MAEAVDLFFADAPANGPGPTAYDGDSFFREGGGTTRAKGYDAPEMRPYQGGADAARVFFQTQLDAPGTTVEESGVDRYGRPLVDVTLKDGRPVSDVMLQSGMAVPFAKTATPEQGGLSASALARSAIPEARTEFDAWARYDRAVNPMRFSFRDRQLLGDNQYRGDFTRALDRGVAGIKESFGNAAEFLGSKIGSTTIADWGSTFASQAALDSVLAPARIDSFEDAKGFGEIGTWLLEKVGENIPQLGLMAAGAGSGSALAAGVGKAFLRQAVTEAGKRALAVGGARGGAVAATLPQHIGEGFGELKDAGVKAEDTNLPFLTGAINTVLDVAPMEALLRFSFGGLRADMAKDLVKRATEQLARDGVLKSFAKGVGKGSLAGAAAEGPTELAQELVNLTARSYHDPEFRWDSPDVQKRLKEAFAGGAAVGGVFGGAARGSAQALGALARRASEDRTQTSDGGTSESTPAERQPQHPLMGLDPDAGLADPGQPFGRRMDFPVNRTDAPLLNLDPDAGLRDPGGGGRPINIASGATLVPHAPETEDDLNAQIDALRDGRKEGVLISDNQREGAAHQRLELGVERGALENFEIPSKGVLYVRAFENRGLEVRKAALAGDNARVNQLLGEITLGVSPEVAAVPPEQSTAVLENLDAAGNAVSQVRVNPQTVEQAAADTAGQGVTQRVTDAETALARRASPSSQARQEAIEVANATQTAEQDVAGLLTAETAHVQSGEKLPVPINLAVPEPETGPDGKLKNVIKVETAHKAVPAIRRVLAAIAADLTPEAREDGGVNIEKTASGLRVDLTLPEEIGRNETTKRFVEKLVKAVFTGEIKRRDRFVMRPPAGPDGKTANVKLNMPELVEAGFELLGEGGHPSTASQAEVREAALAAISWLLEKGWTAEQSTPSDNASVAPQRRWKWKDVVNAKSVRPPRKTVEAEVVEVARATGEPIENLFFVDEPAFDAQPQVKKRETQEAISGDTAKIDADDNVGRVDFLDTEQEQADASARARQGARTAPERLETGVSLQSGSTLNSTTAKSVEFIHLLLKEAGVVLRGGVRFADTAGIQKLLEDVNDERNRVLLQAVLDDKPLGRVLFLYAGARAQPLIYVSPDVTQDTLRGKILLHETGHVIMRHFMQTATAEQKTALKEVFGSDPIEFEENFANAYMRWAMNGVPTVERAKDIISRDLGRQQRAERAAAREGSNLPGRDLARKVAAEERAYTARGEELLSQNKTAGIVARFFTSMARALRRIWNAGRKLAGLDERHSDFIEALMNRKRREVGEKVRPMRSEWGRKMEQSIRDSGDIGANQLTLPGAHDYLNWTPASVLQRAASSRKTKDILRQSKLGIKTVRSAAKIIYENVLQPFDSRLRAIGNEVTTQLADHFYREPGKGTSTVHGAAYYEEVRSRLAPYMPRIQALLEKHQKSRGWGFLPPEQDADLKEAVEQLIAGRPESPLAKEIGKFFFDVYEDMSKQGVYIPFRKNYFPVAMSLQVLHQDGAKEKIVRIVKEWAKTDEAKEWWADRFRDNGLPAQLTERDAERFAEHLYSVWTTGEGLMDKSFENDAYDFVSPGFSHRKSRQIPSHLMDRLAEFRDRDVGALMNAYVRAGMRRAVWQRRFGLNQPANALRRRIDAVRRMKRGDPEFEQVFNDLARERGALPGMREVYDRLYANARSVVDKKLREELELFGIDVFDPSAKLKLDLAKQRMFGNLTEEDHEWVVSKLIPGYEGTLGADMMMFGKSRPGFRRFSALVIAYEMLRVLSLGVFSQVVDVGAALNRAPEGEKLNLLGTMVKSVLSKSTRDQMLADARMIGAIHDDITEHLLTSDQTIFSGMDKAQRVTSKFFMLNGMHLMTNWSRAWDMAFAKQMIKRWSEEGAEKQLAELGITVDEARRWVGEGMPMHWQDQHSAVLGGLHQFVDEGVVRPNPAMRPTIGNDQRFAMLWMLKSFTWGYTMKVLGYTWNRMKQKWGEEEGTRRFYAALPLLVLAGLTIPIAAFGMEMRWLISPPKDGPKSGWDYSWEAVKRSGISPWPVQLFTDMWETEQHGKVSLIAPLGPVVSQVYDFSTKDLGPTLWRSLPAYPLASRLRDAISD